MSGGHFDYKEYQLLDMAEAVEFLATHNHAPDEFDIIRGYPEEIIEKFREAAVQLKKAYAYIHEIDLLVSGDNGEESFMRGLEEGLHAATQSNDEKSDER